jgi:flagellar hook assembly protein FlgD
LNNNYPNPFNPLTTIRYDLPEDGFVNVTIYDMMGRTVKILVTEEQNAGVKSVQWDATDSFGKPVSAGVYLYQIQAGEYMQTKKMVLLK